MPDLRDLYQEIVLDHGRRPRNHRALPGANRRADGFNPLCGDRITVFVEVRDDVVRDIGFQGSGCAISTASASIMTETIRGKTVEEAGALFEKFHALLTAADGPAPPPPELGKLGVFAGVREFPMRVKCATLPWHTLRSALHGDGGSGTSESDGDDREPASSR